MSRRQKLFILALGLALIVPLVVGFWIGYQEYLDRAQRNWYWDYELESSQLNKRFPVPIDYTRPTITNEDRSFWYFWQPSYSQTLRSYDGGPVVINGDNNPFSGTPRETVDTFTFGDLGALLYDSLLWFITDWRPLQWLESNFGFSQNAAAAHTGNSFLTLTDTDCVVTAVATDPDCWDDTTGAESNGDGTGFLPDGLDTVFMDASSAPGSETGTMDANMVFDSLDTTGFTGIFAIGTLTLDIDTNIVHAAGIITMANSAAAFGLDVGGNMTMSGTASIQCSDSCDMDVDGNVNISSPDAYVILYATLWVVGGTWTNSSTTANWEDVAGSLLRLDGVGDPLTMTFADFTVDETEFTGYEFNSPASSNFVVEFFETQQFLDIWGSATVTLASNWTGTGTSLLDLRNSGRLVVGGYTFDVEDIVMQNTSNMSSTTGRVDVGWDVDIFDDAYIVSTGDGAWTVERHWLNRSTNPLWSFDATITFDGTGSIPNQQIQGPGSLVFADVVLEGTATKVFENDFTTDSVSSTTAVIMEISAGITWTITSGSTVAGASGAVLSLRGQWVGTQWNLSVSGTVPVFTFTDIQDGVANVIVDATAASNTDSGNNVNFNFTRSGGGGWGGEGGDEDEPAPFEPGECIPGQLTVTFKDMTAGPDIVIIYIWDFGDGSHVTTSTNPEIVHTFPEVGIYTINHAVVLTDGSIFRSQVQADVGLCRAPIISQFVFSALIGVIALAIVLWLTWVLTRSRKLMMIALLLTFAAVGMWTILMSF